MDDKYTNEIPYIPPKIDMYAKSSSLLTAADFKMFCNVFEKLIIDAYKYYNINVSIAKILRGPTATSFCLNINSNISLLDFMSLNDEIEIKLGLNNQVRFVSKMSDYGLPAIEIPNPNCETVRLNEILKSGAYKNSNPDSVTCAVGKSFCDESVVLDLSNAPHVLISGSVCTGKTTVINSMILSLIYKYSPNEVRFIIVAKSGSVLSNYKGLPHLLFNDIIDDGLKCSAMLSWAVDEMNNRFRILSLSNTCNINQYNSFAKSNGLLTMPELVVFIDDFSDFASTIGVSLDENLSLLIRKSHACGIHIVLSTLLDGFSLSSITLANIPTRIALFNQGEFRSNINFGQRSVKKLLKNGDCLYLFQMSNLKRVQCATVGVAEQAEIVGYVLENNVCNFDENASRYISDKYNLLKQSLGISDGNSQDKMCYQALKAAIECGYVSISFLQRKFAIGFTRAMRYFDWMVENGYVSKVSENGKRKVTLSLDEFYKKFGNLI